MILKYPRLLPREEKSREKERLTQIVGEVFSCTLPCDFRRIGMPRFRDKGSSTEKFHFHVRKSLGKKGVSEDVLN